eukprot:scaffold13575_cov16-Tisochrysis_lutea.AAC.1
MMCRLLISLMSTCHYEQHYEQQGKQYYRQHRSSSVHEVVVLPLKERAHSFCGSTLISLRARVEKGTACSCFIG